MNLQALFQSGQIAFVMIAIMAAEALFFVRHFRRFPGMVLGLGAGASLVMALRASLMQQAWPTIAIFLSLSLVFHVLEILQWLRLAKHQPR